MGKTKVMSDEVIIASILQHGTIKEAAAAVGISPRTVYERMKDPDFRAEYMEAKTDIIRKSVIAINEKISAAIDTVAEIMTDPDVNPATRLQAAQTILKNSGSFAIRLESEEYNNRKENEPDNPWGF